MPRNVGHDDLPEHLDTPVYIAVNSARVCLERYRVRGTPDLLETAMREIDDAVDLLRQEAERDAIRKATRRSTPGPVM